MLVRLTKGFPDTYFNIVIDVQKILFSLDYLIIECLKSEVHPNKQNSSYHTIQETTKKLDNTLFYYIIIISFILLTNCIAIC